MKTTTFAAAFIAALPAVLAQQGPVINSPSPANVVFCQPLLLSWQGGVPPYFITAVAPGQTQTYETFTKDPTTDMQLTWTIDLAPGSVFNLGIKDSTGATNFAAPVTVLANPQASTTCTPNSVALGGAAPTSTGAPASSPTGGAGSTTGAGGSSTPASGSNTSKSASDTGKPTGSTTGTGAKPSGTSGASRVVVGMTGLAAVVGFAAMLV